MQNYNIKKISLVCFLQMIGLVGLSQEIERFIPTTVEAGSLGKYANWSITQNTGALNESIPIYDIMAGDISVPITLDYVLGNGIRVNDNATWVGLGWKLNVGGAIIRNVVGEDDLTITGYKNSRVPDEQEINDPYGGFLDFPSDAVFHGWDTEPDIFHYVLPNKNGQFVFQNQGGPLHLEASLNKVHYREGTDDFEIIDHNGTSYVFGDKEYVSRTIYTGPGNIVGQTKSPCVTWYLTRIVSSDKLDTITFKYNGADGIGIVENNFSFYQTYGADFNSSFEQLSEINMVQHVTSYNPLYLEYIEYKDIKIMFNSTKDRLDGGGKRLNSIEFLKRSNQSPQIYEPVRRVDFETSYFYSNIQNPTIVNDERNKFRLRLDSILFFNDNNVYDNSYSFEYSNISLPPRGNFAQDDWGYFNGFTTNTTLLRKKRLYTYTNGVLDVGNADRSVNDNLLEACILKKIIYPTKGYKMIDYTPNKYFKSSNELVQRSISCFANGINTTQTTTFVASNFINATVRFELRKVGDVTGLTDLPYVRLKNLTTNTVLHIVRAEVSSNVNYESVIYFENGHEYEIYATIPTSNPATVAYAGLSLNFYKEETVTESSSGYGLRVEQISHYNKNGSLLGYAAFRYGSSENGRGIVVSDLFQRFPFERTGTFTHGILLNTPGQTPGCLPVNKTAKIYYDSSLYPLTFFNGSPLLYDEIAEYRYGAVVGDGSNGKLVKKYKVVQDASLPVVQGYLSTVVQLPVLWKNGKLISESNFKEKDGGFSLLKQINYEYSEIEGVPGRGLKLGEKNTRSGCYNLPRPLSDFYFFDYPIYTGISLLSKQDEILYDNNGANPVTTRSIEYYYNEIFQNNKVVERRSDGREKRTEIQFTYEAKTEEQNNVVAQAMFDKNVLNSVFQTKEIIGGELVNHFRAMYSEFSTSLYAPYKLEKMDMSSNTWYVLADYLSYNKRNQPISYSSNGINIVIVWGYGGQYPIAKIENATHAEVVTALGGTTAANTIFANLNQYGVSESAVRTHLHTIRTNLSKAQVSTYTYQTLVGMSSSTDPDGRTLYYEYDGFGRLSVVKDFEGNILKTYHYNYAGQFTDEPGRQYYNKGDSVRVQRNDCGSNREGTFVTYVVPAQKYSSSVSQAVVDSLERDDIFANAQAYANQNGICEWVLITQCVKKHLVFQGGQNIENNLYVTYMPCGGTNEVTVSVNNLPSILGENETVTIEICSNPSASVAFRYGIGGAIVTIPEILVLNVDFCD